jgi:hypothetical protein
MSADTMVGWVSAMEMSTDFPCMTPPILPVMVDAMPIAPYS